MEFKKRFKSHHDSKRELAKFSDQTMISKEEFLTKIKEEKLDYKKNHCIYVHIPFCDKICAFCNLNRKIIDNTIDSYVDKLLVQIDEIGSIDNLKQLKIDSIFFGGGTPTILDESQLINILERIKEKFNVTATCEITLETTLHNLSEIKFKKLNKNGFNRISVGIQTFDDEGRVFLNRTFNKEKTVEKLKNIISKFDGIVAIDKIYNYQIENINSLKEDAKTIKDLDIDSVSFYSLMIHKGSVLSKSDEYSRVKEETDFEYHNIFIEEMLKDRNYEILELTKISKKNRDNYKYIKIRNNMGYTIPLGEGAGGEIGDFGIMHLNFDKTMIVKELNPMIKKGNYIYGKFQFNDIEIREEDNVLNNEEINFINSILSNLEKEYIVTKYKTGHRYTRRGLFYGNNICAFVVKSFYKRFYREGLKEKFS